MPNKIARRLQIVTAPATGVAILEVRRARCPADGENSTLRRLLTRSANRPTLHTPNVVPLATPKVDWRRHNVVRFVLTLGLAVGLVGMPARVQAEGSRSLYPASYPPAAAPEGAGRADLDYSATGSLYLGKVRRRGFLYVYAQQNEYIVLGSRNRSSGGDISIYNPQSFGTPGDETVPGTADFTCSGGSTQPGTHYSGGALGTITTRLQELAGPNSADNTVAITNGFAPCAYQAPVTGTYGVVFSPATAGGNANPNAVIDPPAISRSTISAWDVTVRANASSVTDLNGRLFTYAFVGFTGSNGVGKRIYSTLFYVTGDGYRYQQDLRGLDPNGYALYGNPLGFLDNLQPLYKDIRGADALVITSVPPGVTTQVAQYPIFFSDVSPGGANATEINRVLTALGIPLTPPSPTVTNVSFSGHLGGSTTTVGAGGTFHFDTADTITYLIVVSRDGTDFSLENTTNALLTGIAATGSHAVTWDGRDQTGALFPSNGTPYPFRVWGRNGEVHFPIVDAENNLYGGPTITRLNGTNPGDHTVFYDDRGYRTSSGTVVGNPPSGTLCPNATPTGPNPRMSLDGTDSSVNTPPYYRSWPEGSNANADCSATAGWGDAKAINLWTYFSTPNENNTLVVDPIIVDVSTTVTAPSSTTVGSTVQGAFSFANNGNSTALGVSYTMTLTPGLGTVTFAGMPGAATASYDTATGVVTFTNMPATLTAGQTLSGMTFSYTAPATGPIVATTTIGTTSPEETYLTNNTATVSTGIGTVDVSTTVSVPATALTGSTVSGTFTFANYGANAATGVTYSVTIGNAGNYPASVTFTSLPSGMTASYNPANGVVTFTGLPTTLASGRSFFFGFDYPAPTPGVVPVSTGITTTSSDAVPANNTATGSTTITIPDLVITKTDGVATVVPGASTTYTITVTNTGSGDAVGATVTDTFPVAITSASWTCSASAGSSCTAGPATGNIGDTVTLLASGTLTYTVTATISAAATGSLVNTATVSPPSGITDPTPGDNTRTDTDALTPQAADADLAIAKTGPATFAPGGDVVYTIVVTNGGPSDGTSVVVSDLAPPGFGFVSNAGDCTTAFPCSLGTVPVGQSRTITATFHVPPDYSGPARVVNRATVSSPDDSNPDNNSSSAQADEMSGIPLLGGAGLIALALLVGLAGVLVLGRKL